LGLGIVPFSLSLVAFTNIMHFILISPFASGATVG